MDIAGAKALKQRLGAHGADEAPPVAADVEIPEDAPPVYQWLGVSRPTAGGSPADDDDEPAAAASLFRRLGLSFGFR